jgi:hypothetical protein
MVEIRKCACGCGAETGRKSKTGRLPLYASGACRVRALRRRRALENLGLSEELQSIPDLATPERVVVSSSSADEQLARSILEARSIGYAFVRLGATARPELGWRASKTGNAILSALAEFFPNSER